MCRGLPRTSNQTMNLVFKYYSCFSGTYNQPRVLSCMYFSSFYFIHVTAIAKCIMHCPKRVFSQKQEIDPGPCCSSPMMMRQQLHHYFVRQTVGNAISITERLLRSAYIRSLSTLSSRICRHRSA